MNLKWRRTEGSTVQENALSINDESSQYDSQLFNIKLLADIFWIRSYELTA